MEALHPDYIDAVNDETTVMMMRRVGFSQFQLGFKFWFSILVSWFTQDGVHTRCVSHHGVVFVFVLVHRTRFVEVLRTMRLPELQVCLIVCLHSCLTILCSSKWRHLFLRIDLPVWADFAWTVHVYIDVCTLHNLR